MKFIKFTLFIYVSSMLPMIPKESGGIFDDGSSDSKFSCVLWLLTFILVVITQNPENWQIGEEGHEWNWQLIFLLLRFQNQIRWNYNFSEEFALVYLPRSQQGRNDACGRDNPRRSSPWCGFMNKVNSTGEKCTTNPFHLIQQYTAIACLERAQM